MRQCIICEYSHMITTWNSMSLVSTVMWLQVTTWDSVSLVSTVTWLQHVIRQCITCEYSHMTTTWGNMSLVSTVTWLQHEAGVTCERSHITTTWGRASLKAVINFQRWLYNCGMYDRLLWETTNSEVTIKWLRNVRLKLALGYPDTWYHMNPESQEKRENLKPRTLISHSMVTWPSVVPCGNWPIIMQSYVHDWKWIIALTLPAVSVM